MAFRALWQTPNRANARLKATIGGFHGPLTLFIEIPLFFDIPFNPYHSEKIDIADSEYRTPESKFRLFWPWLSRILGLLFRLRNSRPLPPSPTSAERGMIPKKRRLTSVGKGFSPSLALWGGNADITPIFFLLLKAKLY